MMFEMNDVQSEVSTASGWQKMIYQTKDLIRGLEIYGVKIRSRENEGVWSEKVMRVLFERNEGWEKLVEMFFKAYWVDKADLMDDEVVIGYMKETGVENAEEMYYKCQSDERKKDLVDATQDAFDKGVFGIPTFFVQGEIFYGVDMIEHIKRKLGVPSLFDSIIEYPLFDEKTFPVHFYFDVASPFAFIASQRVENIFGSRNLIYHPIVLGAVFKAVGMANTPISLMSENKRNYNSMELQRHAARTNVQFEFSSHFPLNTITVLRIIHLLGPNTTEGRMITNRFFLAAWSQNKNLRNEEVIINICNDAGLNGEQLVQKAKTDQVVKDKLRRETDKAIENGIFGVPMFIVKTHNNKMMYWGNDKLEWAALEARGHLPSKSNPKL